MIEEINQNTGEWLHTGFLGDLDTGLFLLSRHKKGYNMALEGTRTPVLSTRKLQEGRRWGQNLPLKRFLSNCLCGLTVCFIVFSRKHIIALLKIAMNDSREEI